MAADKCSSCRRELTNDKGGAIFKCPQCLKQEIKRCSHCREIGAKYSCPECGFTGPN